MRVRLKRAWKSRGNMKAKWEKLGKCVENALLLWLSLPGVTFCFGYYVLPALNWIPEWKGAGARGDLRRLEEAACGHLMAGGAACCCNRQHVATKLKYNRQMGEVKRNDFISSRRSSSGSHSRSRSVKNRRRRRQGSHTERHITHTPRVSGTQIKLGFVMN